jgi:hypothetical protein
MPKRLNYGPRARKRRRSQTGILRALVGLVLLQTRNIHYLLEERRREVTQRPPSYLQMPQLPAPKPKVSLAAWWESVQAVLHIFGATLVGVVICAIVGVVGVIVVSLWLRGKPEPKTTIKVEQRHITEVVEISPLDAAVADSMRHCAARLRNVQAAITRLRDELESLSEARLINNNGLIQAIYNRSDHAAAGDAARIASANFLDAEAKRLLSGAEATQHPALLLGNAQAEEKAAHRVVQRLIDDLAYVRRQLELRNETIRRNRP